MPEPIFICKSESTVADPFCSSALVATSYPPPDNAAFIAEAVACGRLSHVIVETARGARAVYASPGFAKYLSGDK